MKTVKIVGLFIAVLALAAFGVYGAEIVSHVFQSAGDAASNVSFASVGVLAMRERKIFNAVEQRYGPGRASDSFLRVDVSLSNSKGDYLFDVKKTGNEGVNERKLDRNDDFVISAFGFFLTKQDTTKVGAEVLNAYPDQQVFASATGFTPAHLETVYSGYYELKIGQKVNIEGLSMQRFRYVPETQKSGATNASEFNLYEMMYNPAGIIILEGTQNIEQRITFPTFSGMQIAAVAANTVNKLVFFASGYLIKNAIGTKKNIS